VNYNRIRVAMRTDTTGMITMKTLEREGAVFVKYCDTIIVHVLTSSLFAPSNSGY